MTHCGSVTVTPTYVVLCVGDESQSLWLAAPCTAAAAFELQTGCSLIVKTVQLNTIKHSAAPHALFARRHSPSTIFSVMHEREQYFKWFIVAAFLASATLNDSKWALRSKLPPTMLARSRGKTGEPL